MVSLSTEKSKTNYSLAETAKAFLKIKNTLRNSKINKNIIN